MRSRHVPTPLPQPFQELPRGSGSLPRTTTAHGARERFHFLQPLKLGAATRNYITNCVMARTIGRGLPSRGPTRPQSIGLIKDVSATHIVLKVLALRGQHNRRHSKSPDFSLI